MGTILCIARRACIKMILDGFLATTTWPFFIFFVTAFNLCANLKGLLRLDKGSQLMTLVKMLARVGANLYPCLVSDSDRVGVKTPCCTPVGNLGTFSFVDVCALMVATNICRCLMAFFGARTALVTHFQLSMSMSSPIFNISCWGLRF